MLLCVALRLRADDAAAVWRLMERVACFEHNFAVYGMDVDLVGAPLVTLRLRVGAERARMLERFLSELVEELVQLEADGRAMLATLNLLEEFDGTRDEARGRALPGRVLTRAVEASI